MNSYPISDRIRRRAMDEEPNIICPKITKNAEIEIETNFTTTDLKIQQKKQQIQMMNTKAGSNCGNLLRKSNNHLIKPKRTTPTE